MWSLVKKLALTSAGIGLGVLLGWLAVRGIEWREVGRILRDFPPGLLAAGVAFLLHHGGNAVTLDLKEVRRVPTNVEGLR